MTVPDGYSNASWVLPKGLGFIVKTISKPKIFFTEIYQLITTDCWFLCRKT